MMPSTSHPPQLPMTKNPYIAQPIQVSGIALLRFLSKRAASSCDRDSLAVNNDKP
jgi:hypothetical protein